MDKINKQGRSQEERRRATTNKLIEATITCVNEKGYSGLKASAIAKQAGVTWGAAQHLFGDKEILLLTVANRTYEELSLALSADISIDLSLDEKVERIVSITWKAFQSEAYQAMVEILRGSRAHPEFNREVLKRQKTVSEDVRVMWLRLFTPSGIDEGMIDEARDFVTLTLSGLAARKIFLHNSKNVRQILNNLSHAALTILQREGDCAPQSEGENLSALI